MCLHKIICKPSCTSSSRASVKNHKFWQAIKKHCIIHRGGRKTPPRGSFSRSRRTENGDEKKHRIYKIEGAFGAPALERENALARKQFLYYGARSGEHCQAAIVEFFVLHLPECLWILGLQSKRVPEWANTEKFIFAIIVGQRSSKLMACGHKPKCGPEIRLSRRREVRCTCGDKFTITPSIEKRVIKIRHDYSQGCLHANAAVLDLCPAVGGNVTTFGESCRVPEA